MAAPLKKGMNYFPLEKEIMGDTRFIRLKMKYGSRIMYFYLALLSHLYANEGYYIDLRGEGRENLILYLWEKCVTYDKGSLEDTEEMLDSIIGTGIFDKAMAERGILTSRHIQEVYYTATAKRKGCLVDPDLWLLSLERMETLGRRSAIYSFFLERKINDVNNSQSKVKEIKVNKSKGNNIKGDESKSDKSTECVNGVGCTDGADGINSVDSTDGVDCINSVDNVGSVSSVDNIEPIDSTDSTNVIDDMPMTYYSLYSSTDAYNELKSFFSACTRSDLNKIKKWTSRLNYLYIHKYLTESGARTISQAEVFINKLTECNVNSIGQYNHLKQTHKHLFYKT